MCGGRSARPKCLEMLRNGRKPCRRSRSARHSPPTPALSSASPQLDSSRPLREPVLVAQVGGDLWAAVSMADFSVVSDPFRPSGELAFILVERARQVWRAERRGTRRRRIRVPALRAA